MLLLRSSTSIRKFHKISITKFFIPFNYDVFRDLIIQKFGSSDQHAPERLHTDLSISFSSFPASPIPTVEQINAWRRRPYSSFNHAFYEDCQVDPTTGQMDLLEIYARKQ